jgi:hypothetical protein
MTLHRAGIFLLLCSFAIATSAGAEDDTWAGYLDYAYVYSSADQDALQQRLTEYGQQAGIRLDDYAVKHLARLESPEAQEMEIRRAAIAQLLLYLASGEPDALTRSVDAVRLLEERLSRHENRYWYHYILAHQALEKGRRYDFVGELLDLWLHVVTPLETPFETLQTLSLSDSPNSGFVSALPYVYENVARLILIRSQEMGVDRDLDPLGAVVRLLHDGRVGAHPEVIPVELTSRQYIDRIVARLDGTESDAGSLTFTLALFEASKFHDQARSLLASQGLSDETVKALRVSSGAYEKALNRALTLQGQAAVYTRVLRQLGEVYAAKQRLGVDPDIETAFTIEGAMEVYGRLHRDGKGGSEQAWIELGYDSREQYVAAMQLLWTEAREVSLNAADYYLTRAVENPVLASEHSRSASRIYSRYLAFFHRFTKGERRATVPDAAYFAAYEAARGYGDAMLHYADGRVSSKEMELATRRYVSGLRIFPFDRELWTGITSALERRGLESQYIELTRPIAESVTQSRHVNAWIEDGEPGATRIAVLRRAMADSQAVIYMGFADEAGIAELESSIGELHTQREELMARLEALTDRRKGLGRALPASADPNPSVQDEARQGILALEVGEIDTELDDGKALLERLDKQIGARTRALPLYKATLETDGLADEMRAQRDHPLHTLLRRMYHETRS